MTPPPTDPPDVQAAREAARALRHADCIAAELDAHAALDAALDTLTARLAVVEGERDKAAATERARILRYLTAVRRRIPGTRGFTAEMQLLFGVLVDEIAAAIESNAHHEATK